MHLTLAIATWNRAELLAETLASLATLDVPDGVTWEVLVCDNNSSDHTKATVEEFVAMKARGAVLQGKAGLTEVRSLFEPTQGKSHALNQILREATGSWVLFLDDDVLVDPQWLKTYVEAIARHPKAGVLGGAVLPRLYKDVRGKQAFLLEHYPGAYGVLKLDADTPIGDPTPSPGGANMAVLREVAQKHGFALNFGMIGGERIAGEDAGMAINILREGYQGWLLADAKVLHHTPSDSLTRRRLWQWQKGFGRVRAFCRGKPQKGKFGIAWWAWREMIRLWLGVIVRWRPWPTKGYYHAYVVAAQYWGYMTAK
ncbi:MAG: glycosyltransferase family 2 protein [Phycisphaeraceae bacterium]